MVACPPLLISEASLPVAKRRANLSAGSAVPRVDPGREQVAGSLAPQRLLPDNNEPAIILWKDPHANHA
jgi:hypothetical protein